MNLAKMSALARKRFRMNPKGIHGPSHWERVYANGLYLVQHAAADLQVVQAFAFLHDCCRESDGEDPAHGSRAAAFAQSIADTLDLGDQAIELLLYACKHHDQGGLSDHPTVGACWDADRLDLGRVGIQPRPEYLSLACSRRAAVIRWAYHRSRGRPCEEPN